MGARKPQWASTRWTCLHNLAPPMLVLRIHRCSCSHSRASALRKYSSQPSIPPLPPPAQWKARFPINNTLRRERAVIKDPDAARLVARSFLSQAKSNNGGKIVIEAFPGMSHISSVLQVITDGGIFRSRRPVTRDARVALVRAQEIDHPRRR